MTLIDAYLAGAILAGLALNATLRWWADPLAGLVIIFYGGAREALGGTLTLDSPPGGPTAVRAERPLETQGTPR